MPDDLTLLSYCGPAPLPSELLARWNFDPLLLTVMALAAMALYPRLRGGERTMLGAAIVVLLVIFVSPLCALTVALFSARVVHHVLLVAIAAPMLAVALRRVLPSAQLALLLLPLTLLHTVVFWLWHAPDAYAFALGNTAVYWLMQVTLLGTAILVWNAIFAAPIAQSLVSLLMLTIQMGLLGALLVFAEAPLYVPHLATTQAFGFDPRTDQQLAGLVMWVPANLPYLAFALWRLAAWLGRPGAQHS